jgi:lipid II:glycine glycyltransferase (peptidoglycan interpeptide bridge formation enzyme)
MSYLVETSRKAGWDEAAWDAFVAGHPAAHPLQLRAWGALKREFGWEDARVGLRQEGKLVAGAQVLFKKLPRLGFLPLRIAYIPKGPLVDWRDAAQTEALFQALHRFCRRNGAILLKIEPEAVDAPDLAERFRALGFRPSSRTIQPRTTVWLDLDADEDALLARMKQKWRYNIRLAGRKGVTVRLGDEADLDLFGALMQATAARNTFGVHTTAYYRRFWELFAPERAALLIAEHEGQALAALMTAHLAGKAYYLYGASGNQKRNLMPSHKLQWETMRWARSENCSGYDLWGVPDEVGLHPDAPIPDPAAGLWGVWRFKRGFGGRVVRYTGAWDYAYWPGLGVVSG